MSNRRQPQRLPPPIMDGGEGIDAELILREFPEDQALVLWKTVRAVRMWSELEEGDRGSAFTAGAYERRTRLIEDANLPGEILSSLAKAATVLQPRTRPAVVAAGCRSVASWASEKHALGTALEFQQAAAVALPGEAELAFEAARIARSRGEYARAETWYRHAISRGRRSRNWYEFSRSYIGLGAVATLRGNHASAKRSLIRGVRAAKRFALWPLVAAAYHELTILSIRRQNHSDVTRYVQLALEAYGLTHPRLPSLAFEYAVYLLDAGYPEEALRTLKTVPAEFGGPAERLARAAEMARAAGGVNDTDAFESAWRTAMHFLEDPSSGSRAAAAYLSLARGAGSLGDWERAEQAALDAQRIAIDRDQDDIRSQAKGFLEAIGTGAAAHDEAERPHASSKVRQVVKEFEARSDAARLI